LTMAKNKTDMSLKTVNVQGLLVLISI